MMKSSLNILQGPKSFQDHTLTVHSSPVHGQIRVYYLYPEDAEAELEGAYVISKVTSQLACDWYVPGTQEF